VLRCDSKSEHLAKRLVGSGRLPEQARTDAEDVATAATNSVDVLLTWNCKHLANPIIHQEVVRACEAEGFRCPEIARPKN
jgi:hypothetical protein